MHRCLRRKQCSNGTPWMGDEGIPGLAPPAPLSGINAHIPCQSLCHLPQLPARHQGRTPGSAQQRSPKKFHHGENLPQLGSQADASITCLLQRVKPTAAAGLGLREIIFNWINTDNTAKAGSLLTPGVTFNASLHSELHTISHPCECTAQTENSLTPQIFVCTRGQ